MTWPVFLAAVPDAAIERLTSTELAELIDAMRRLTEETKGIHERDIVSEGAVWDARQQRHREIGS